MDNEHSHTIAPIWIFVPSSVFAWRVDGAAVCSEVGRPPQQGGLQFAGRSFPDRTRIDHLLRKCVQMASKNTPKPPRNTPRHARLTGLPHLISFMFVHLYQIWLIDLMSGSYHGLGLRQHGALSAFPGDMCHLLHSIPACVLQNTPQSFVRYIIQKVSRMLYAESFCTIFHIKSVSNACIWIILYDISYKNSL